MKYNILETALDSYLVYHWKRTEEARRIIGMSLREFKNMWTKNYYREKSIALEQELTKVKARLVEVLKGKLNEM